MANYEGISKYYRITQYCDPELTVSEQISRGEAVNLLIDTLIASGKDVDVLTNEWTVEGRRVVSLELKCNGTS